ncbi:MAG: ribosome silencing factor [Victivallaceae bacterium]|nr:ribosome silencing factor [Victivallaceae bacterium]
MTRPQIDARLLAEFCAREAEEKKGADIVTLTVTGLTTIADYFVLCTVQSEPQMRALSAWIRKRVFEDFRVKPLTIDGESVSRWILIDFGTVLMHIMTPEMRDRYQLETLWGDAPQLKELRKLEELSGRK